MDPIGLTNLQESSIRPWCRPPMAGWLEDLVDQPDLELYEILKLWKKIWPWFIGKMLGKPSGWYHPLNNQPHQYIWKNIYIGYWYIGSQSPLKPAFGSLNLLVKNNHCLARVEGFPKSVASFWCSRHGGVASRGTCAPAVRLMGCWENSGVMQWYPPWN